jgi:hypothetical protein
MAVSGKVYYPMLQHAFLGEIDTTMNIRVSLHSSTYTPSQTHSHVSDLTNELGTTLGYTAEGQTLASVAVTNATATTKISASNAEWTSATISARYAVIYCRNGANSASWPLMGYVDFGETMSSSAGTFTIAWSTNGIITITTD